jgi:hypothetical protein
MQNMEGPMGDTIWLDVEGRSESEELRDCTIMLRMTENLDNVSQKLGIASIAEFFDYSALEENYAEFLPEPEAQACEKPSGKWFDAGAVMAVIRPLRAHLQSKPSDLAFVSNDANAHWMEHLMDELRYCEDALEDAASHGKRVRFLLVP